MEIEGARLKEAFLEEKVSFPYDKSSILTDFFFGWVFSTISYYRRHPPTSSNLYDIPKNINIISTFKILKSHWKIEQEKPKPVFLRAIMKTIRKEYFIAVALIMVGQLQFLPIAMLTNYLIEYLMDPDRPIYEGALLTLAFIVINLTSSCTRMNGGYRMLILTGKVKNIIAMMISDKVLKLNDGIVNEQSTRGKILNIVNNDMEQLEMSIFTAFFWGVPFTIILSVIVIIFTFGPAGLIGIGLSFIHFLVILILGKIRMRFKIAANLLGDSRIKMIENLVSGIKIMKLYAWEMPILKKIYSKREAEIAQLSKFININALCQLLGLAGMGLIIYVTLLLQVHLGNTLTPGKVLMMILIIGFTHVNIVGLTTSGLSTILMFVTIMQRTGEVLRLKEYSKQSTISDQTNAISFSNASFSWRGESNKAPDENNQSLPQLKAQISEISLNISPGEIIVVVGPVGCGKSSLLMGILGEINLSSGSFSVEGSVAYASEEPWILSASIKENILMGRPYNASLYAETLSSCSLATDLELFKDRDETLVGDRGATLSGGQKSRVSLARAVYSAADVFLLDDPLSAVDAEVANQIFQHCIKEQLRGKTVILASHQLQFLAQADKVLVLEAGRVMFFGRYDQLLEEESMEKRLWALVSEEKDDLEKVKVIGVAEAKESNEVVVESTEVTDGNVRFSSYYRYIKFGFKNVFVLILVTIITFCSQAAFQLIIFWSSFWSKQSNQTAPYLIQTMAILLGGLYVLTALRVFSFINLMLRSNINLHNKALESMATSPAGFFDANPTGHIINRFTKDIGVVDGPLQHYLYESYSTTIVITSYLLVSILILPYALLSAPVVVLLAVLAYKYVSPLIIKLRRLELISRGPLISTLNSAMNGLPTLRCLGLQKKFKNDVEKQAISHFRAYITFHTLLRFSQLWSDFATVLVITANVIILVASKGYVEPALGSLSLACTTSLLGLVSIWNKNLLETGSSMASAQRLLEYADLPGEGCFTRPAVLQITHGNIQFRDVYMRYRHSLPHCLAGLNLEIQAGHKVGIIGRTGAGKSSILQVLFRLVNPESGTILIDGNDYMKMGLHDLRKQMSVIPQTAILFTASIRENLDPFLLHTDQELIETLKEFKLTDAIFEHGSGLGAELNGESISFSAGQKQLLCLARAVLRKNKIIMMDEATANVDNETDRIIQDVVKQKFKECTLLVIAHRIRTVIQSDEIIVMDKGICKEYGTPAGLYRNEHSLFRNLVEQSGVSETHLLRSKAS